MTREKRLVRIALIQLMIRENRSDQLSATSHLISEAVKNQAEIICLPELFTEPYFPQIQSNNYKKQAEPIPGPLTEYLQNEARKNRIVLVGGSIYELNSMNKRYNTTLVIGSNGEILCKYRKMHIPHDPQYWEQFYFSPGNLGYPQVHLPHITLAPLICYDQWFPEPARIHALQGTQLLIYPTAIGWIDQMIQEEPFSAQRWEDSMRAHASMNGIYVAAINRVGKEQMYDPKSNKNLSIQFWGNSFIADPYGQVIAKASSTDEQFITGSIDLEKITACQEGWGFLRNRRPDSYSKLLE